MEKYWRDAILKNVPHGEDASLQLTPSEAIAFATMMVKKGYAICITGGDIGDNVRVSWLYAGNTDNLEYADYGNVVFTSIDYMEDYPEAVNEFTEEDDEVEDDDW